MREFTENNEKLTLSKYASLSINTKGRKYDEPKCEFRTDYARDRDRIIHSNAFRRLKQKTQVFFSPNGDHYRTRLTHTLEVSQIARTISRCLRLNEDLCEAIALGHDLGHTPFGHMGESVLNSLSEFEFDHAIQSVRVVSKLEQGGKGLNLTYETLNGIACHSTDSPKAKTMEGRVVEIADKIAYINHDIEDAIRAKIISLDDLPKDDIKILGNTKSKRITTLIKSIVNNSADKNDIIMDNEIKKAHLHLRKFLFENVYFSDLVKSEDDKAKHILTTLYHYYQKYPHKMTKQYYNIYKSIDGQRAICDFLASMTEKYLLATYSEIYIPKYIF